MPAFLDEAYFNCEIGAKRVLERENGVQIPMGFQLRDASPILAALFDEFCKKEYSHENIAFFNKIYNLNKRIRKIPPLSDKEIDRELRKIYDTSLSEKLPQYVNVSGPARKNIEDVYNSDRLLTMEHFSAAIVEHCKFLKTDTGRRFVDTAIFKEYITDPKLFAEKHPKYEKYFLNESLSIIKDKIAKHSFSRWEDPFGNYKEKLLKHLDRAIKNPSSNNLISPRLMELMQKLPQDLKKALGESLGTQDSYPASVNTQIESLKQNLGLIAAPAPLKPLKSDITQTTPKVDPARSATLKPLGRPGHRRAGDVFIEAPSDNMELERIRTEQQATEFEMMRAKQQEAAEHAQSVKVGSTLTLHSIQGQKLGNLVPENEATSATPISKAATPAGETPSDTFPGKTPEVTEVKKERPK